MTDSEALKIVIKDSGIPMTRIARKLGITRECLYNKVNGASGLHTFITRHSAMDIMIRIYIARLPAGTE